MSITTLNNSYEDELRVTNPDDAKKELDRYVIVYARDEEDALNVARNNGFNPTHKEHCSRSLVMQTRKPFVYIDKYYWGTDSPIRLCDPFKFLSNDMDILGLIRVEMSSDLLENKPSIDPEDSYTCLKEEEKSITISRKDLEQSGIFSSEEAEGIDVFFWVTKVINPSPQEKAIMQEGEELFKRANPLYYRRGVDTYRIDKNKITYYVTGQPGNCLEDCDYHACNPEFVLWKVKVN